MTIADEEARLDVPRHDLIRGVTPLRAEEDGNVMVGYPIVFNQWTEIDSWEGRFLEQVAPSGPAKSMKDGRQRVQYNHGMHPVIGSSGLGTPRVLKRDSFGVYTETPLSDTSYNRDIIKPLLTDGTLDGMSFRFSVIEDKWKKPKEPSEWNAEMLPERTLIEFKWMEFGPVDWPAYEATIAGIRSAAGLALWLATPTEQRMALMRKFDISVSPEPRFIAPGWDAKTIVPIEERDDDPAGADATGEQDSGPGPDPTRSDDPEPEVVTYQPAERPRTSAARRETHSGLVRAWVASTERTVA